MPKVSLTHSLTLCSVFWRARARRHTRRGAARRVLCPPRARRLSTEHSSHVSRCLRSLLLIPLLPLPPPLPLTTRFNCIALHCITLNRIESNRLDCFVGIQGLKLKLKPKSNR